MAGDWIKVRSDLHEQREVVIVARELGIPRAYAVGLCVRFWGWADGNTADGNLAGMSGQDLDGVIGVEGFAAAMKAAGWLVEDQGGLIIPNHERHNGTSAKRRALDVNRKRRIRSQEE